MFRYEVLSHSSEFKKTDIRTIKNLFNLSVKKEFAFERGEKFWVEENIESNRAIALRDLSTGKILANIFLIPFKNSTATAQAALWRAPQYADSIFAEMSIIAQAQYQHVYMAIYKRNTFAQSVVLSHPNVFKRKAGAIDDNLLKSLLFDDEKHHIFEWRTPITSSRALCELDALEFLINRW